jgi:hypothetical protein
MMMVRVALTASALFIVSGCAGGPYTYLSSGDGNEMTLRRDIDQCIVQANDYLRRTDTSVLVTTWIRSNDAPVPASSVYCTWWCPIWLQSRRSAPGPTGWGITIKGEVARKSQWADVPLVNIAVIHEQVKAGNRSTALFYECMESKGYSSFAPWYLETLSEDDQLVSRVGYKLRQECEAADMLTPKA